MIQKLQKKVIKKGNKIYLIKKGKYPYVITSERLLYSYIKISKYKRKNNQIFLDQPG